MTYIFFSFFATNCGHCTTYKQNKQATVNQTAGRLGLVLKEWVINPTVKNAQGKVASIADPKTTTGEKIPAFVVKYVLGDAAGQVPGFLLVNVADWQKGSGAVTMIPRNIVTGNDIGALENWLKGRTGTVSNSTPTARTAPVRANPPVAPRGNSQWRQMKPNNLSNLR